VLSFGDPGTYYLRLSAFDTDQIFSPLNLDSSGHDTELTVKVTGN
jgi:hypothetical protein